MVWARRLWLRLQTLVRRQRVSQRLDDEIQFHLEQQIAENIAAGMSREEAPLRCRASFWEPYNTQGRDAGHLGLDIAGTACPQSALCRPGARSRA